MAPAHETPYLLDTNLPHCPPSPWQPVFFFLCLCECNYYRYLIWMVTYMSTRFWPFVTGLFHLA
jgi:hypothetical protein